VPTAVAQRPLPLDRWYRPCRPRTECTRTVPAPGTGLCTPRSCCVVQNALVHRRARLFGDFDGILRCGMRRDALDAQPRPAAKRGVPAAPQRHHALRALGPESSCLLWTSSIHTPRIHHFIACKTIGIELRSADHLMCSHKALHGRDSRPMCLSSQLLMQLTPIIPVSARQWCESSRSPSRARSQRKVGQ
jgi:hypothetical protein